MALWNSTGKIKMEDIADNIIAGKRSVSRDEMRELDRKAIEDYEIPGILLMENAGRNVAEEVMKMLDKDSNRKIAIICGKGNNGGDGFVIARHLHNSGYDVIVVLLAASNDVLGDGDTGLNFKIIKNMGIGINEVLSAADIVNLAEQISNCALIVDAIFGTGLNGELREPAMSVVTKINALNIPVVSVDIPTGLDCNNGEVLGACIRAKKTVTFALPKKGFFIADGPKHVGDLVVTDIGIPRELLVGN
ncbi:MAG: NAD(P)H-hydrate epimerase [Candidatus Anammoxibacter sp.]